MGACLDVVCLAEACELSLQRPSNVICGLDIILYYLSGSAVMTLWLLGLVAEQLHH
jgi:hypothetical protein